MQRITVIGAGVIGLTTACDLQEQGLNVHILTRRLPGDTTSAVAAAIWLPFHAAPEDLVNAWSLKSYLRYVQISQEPDSGVSMVKALVLSTPEQARRWIPSLPPHAWEVEVSDLPEGYVSAMRVIVPMIQTQRYLPWLAKVFESRGGIIRQGTLDRFEKPEAGSVIVNCTGLGARKLCHDRDLYPVKGQIMKVAMPGQVPYVIDDEGPNAIAYILQRDDCVILGGTTETDFAFDGVEEAKNEGILHRCQKIYPDIRSARFLSAEVGFRPARYQVRLEWDSTLPVIHNYGHGGCGYTLSWGCAGRVSQLLQERFQF